MSYAGCKMFMERSRLAGIIVQTEGELAGCVWDFFASPNANARSAYDVMLMAIQEGCTRIITYDHPLLIMFFERFCFQTVARTESGFVHMNLSARELQARLSAFIAELALTPRRTPSWNREQAACAYCESPLLEPPYVTENFGGHHCKRCGFVQVSGTLTPSPPDAPLGPIRLTRSN
jgi:hypothetical protein